MRPLRLAALLAVSLVACVEEPVARAPSGPFTASAEIAVQNRMSSAFRLRKLTVALDGAPLTDTSDEALLGLATIELGARPLQAGDHAVVFHLVFQGNGSGVFAYLRNYSFDVHADQKLRVEPGARLRFVCEAYEKGTATTPIEERPALRCATTTL